MFRSASLVSLALCLSFPLTATAEEKPRQLVLVSFDGAGDNALWVKSRDMAKRTGARFTYFLSCTLIMDRVNAKAYQAPGHKPGRSNIGFGQSAEEVRERLDHLWQAHGEGHDIASHACGHFDGKDWSAKDWSTEFEIFNATFRNAWKTIGAEAQEPQGWREFADTTIKGFRAPYLSVSDGLTAAQKNAGLLYDASTVTKGPMMPRNRNGIMHFGLPLIPEGPKQRPVIGMDYNLFVRHSAGVENPSRSAEFEERTFAAFKAAFEKEYKGDRIPLQLGFHFVEMNGGAYWRALDRLLTDVCHRDDVDCVSYAEAVPLVTERLKKQKADESAF